MVGQKSPESCVVLVNHTPRLLLCALLPQRILRRPQGNHCNEVAAGHSSAKQKNFHFASEQPILFGFRCNRNELSLRKKSRFVNRFLIKYEPALNFIHSAPKLIRLRPRFRHFARRKTPLPARGNGVESLIGSGAAHCGVQMSPRGTFGRA